MSPATEGTEHTEKAWLVRLGLYIFRGFNAKAPGRKPVLAGKRVQQECIGRHTTRGRIRDQGQENAVSGPAPGTIVSGLMNRPSAGS
jgi:hypothetical protein